MKKLKKKQTDKIRDGLLEELMDLKENTFQHLKDATKAVVPCMSCGSGYNNNEGECGYCHGTKARPDEKQRNWAAEEVLSRLIPKPKPVEITQKEVSDVNEFEKEVEEQLKAGKSVDELLKDYGIKVSNKTDSTEKS